MVMWASDEEAAVIGTQIKGGVDRAAMLAWIEGG
jgi:hypothetical protein